MTKNVFPCGPLGQLTLECLWGGGGVLLADPWGKGNSSKGGGQSQADEDHPQRSVDNYDHREAQPAALSGHARFRMFKTVDLAPQPSKQDTGPTGLQTQLRGSWGSPPSRTAGQSSNLWYLLLQAVPRLSSRSAGSWLYAKLTPAAAQEQDVKHPLGPPTPHPGTSPRPSLPRCPLYS